MHPQHLSWMFHTDNIHLAVTCADAMAIRAVLHPTAAEPEAEINDLQEALAPLRIDGIISGALASEYQRCRIERVCHALHLKSFAPLWHKNPSQLLNDMIRADFSIAVIAVAAEGLGKAWLGRILDMDALNDLKRVHDRYGVHVGGEGGEYETLVLDCPLYRQHLHISEAEAKWDGSRGTLQITRVSEIPKE